MAFHIPLTISSLEKLKEKSKMFQFLVKNKRPAKLQQYLTNCDIKLTEQEYLSISIKSFVQSFVVLYVITTTILVLIQVSLPFLLGLGLAFVFSSFVFFSQLVYPKVYNSRRLRNIERNLIPALQDMLVQLNAGIPLYNIMINISSSKYGALSEEFSKAVKKINAGFPQIEVLEELGEKNTSNYLKRTLWQLSNGMRAGSDITIVIQENIKTLTEEQLIQIQNYGNKLNPLIMFYMVISLILPALSIVFLTIISSMINLPGPTTILLFLGLFVFTILIQIMFLGMIKSVRPSLL